MELRDTLYETTTALWANKVRSALTILGIVIGISSVIAMVSIGAGAQSSIQSSIQSIGSNLLIVMPGAQRGPGVQVSSGRGSAKTLTQDDADAIAASISGINAVAPDISGRYQVTARGTNTNTNVTGVTPAYADVRNVAVESGSFITEANVRTAAKVAVLGPATAEDLFGEDGEPVGEKIRIKGIEFKIIGVTTAKGGSGFSNPDDAIYVPLSSAARFLSGDEYVSTISVQATDPDAMTIVQADITALILEQHHITDATAADFSVMNQADIVATASTVTQTFTIFLAAVAGISLIVGGIGIMNMMLTNVTERTREIGLRMAIGAKRGEITAQFLSEAIALTVLGGVIGIALGLAIAYGVKATGILQTSVSPWSIILATGVSAAIGIIFGLYPARRAANLNPIEALRYE